jgi:hypothetical protein
MKKNGNIKTTIWGWEPMAHACNPSYSGGRDQEFKASLWTIVLQDPISKTNPSRKGCCFFFSHKKGLAA